MSSAVIFACFILILLDVQEAYSAHNLLSRLNCPSIQRRQDGLSFDEPSNVYDDQALRLAMAGNMLTNESRIMMLFVMWIKVRDAWFCYIIWFLCVSLSKNCFFGDEEYKHMLCVEATAVEKTITLKPGEEWRVRQELSTVNKLPEP
ncbi:putative glucose-6-phosphate 1-epimerase [Tanacetum coccineum]